MRIGLYVFWNVEWDGTTLRAAGANTRFVRQLLESADGVRLFTPVSPTSGRYGDACAVSDPRLEVVPLPSGSYASAWCRLLQIRRTLQRNLDGLDAVYVRLFDPCPWLLAPLCKARGIGVVYDMVGDPVQGIWQHRDWSWPRRCLTRALFWPEEVLTFRAAREHSLLFAGWDLARLYGSRHPAPEILVPSTLEQADFYHRHDTCSNGCATVLYTGVVRPAKRVETLIEAVGILARRSVPLRLRIVGPFESARYARSVQAFVEAQGVADRVDFCGYVALGEPLNREYRAADIYAFPSLTEGAARTLLEAAAHALPMVVTDVGSARDLFSDGESALIVPPDDPPAMAQALARIIHEPELRRRCLQNAYAVASKHTCRAFTSAVVARLGDAARRACSKGNGR